MEVILNNILDKKWVNIILLFTIIGEFFIPWILKHYYIGYDSKRMEMSVLGSPESPVRYVYNLWLIWLGIFLIFIAIGYYKKALKTSRVLAILIFLSISTFAIGAGILSGLFSVNESKDVVTISSQIHDIGASIGFTTLLFFPLLNGIIEFKLKNSSYGVENITAFMLSLIFFAIFIMCDKEVFRNTDFANEGQMERITLLCMYIPFMNQVIGKLVYGNS